MLLINEGIDINCVVISRRGSYDIVGIKFLDSIHSLGSHIINQHERLLSLWFLVVPRRADR